MPLARAPRHVRFAGTPSPSSGGEDRAARDPLSDVLQDVRITGASYCRTEMYAPWGLALSAAAGAAIHVVVEGRCRLEVEGEAPLELGEGDVVLLPHGAAHSLVDAPGAVRRAIHELHRERIGDQVFRLRGASHTGVRALLVCCEVAFEATVMHPLLEAMPEVIHVPHGDPALAGVLDAMAAEVREQRLGAATVMARLADIIVTRVLRAWVERHTEATPGWLAAIRDPQIGSALAAIHRNPERPWDVEALAAVAHLSRSQFAERFAASLGVTPARYVAAWRMHLAARWLASSHLSIGEVATRLGYDSEAAFSRAFKRIVGTPPSHVRSAS